MAVTRTAVLAVVLVLVACYSPPQTAPERPPVAVTAPFVATWNSVIDAFASRNIPIRNIDKSSGLIVAEMAVVPETDQSKPSPYADCGHGGGGIVRENYVHPERAVYNILVRGDSSASSVRVTTSYYKGLGRNTIECTSTGSFESGLEVAIKQRAEAR